MSAGGPITRLRALRAAQDGAAAVEFAFVLPLFLLLTAGLFDGARLINVALQVHAAAQAGATYAQLNGWDPSGISSAVAAATPLGASATPTLAQGCVEGLAIDPPNGGGACASSQPVGAFVTVTAQAPFTPLAPGFGPVWPKSLRATAVVRIS